MKRLAFIPRLVAPCGLGTLLVISGLLLTSGCALTKPRPKHDPFSEFSCGEKCPAAAHSKTPHAPPTH